MNRTAIAGFSGAAGALALVAVFAAGHYTAHPRTTTRVVTVTKRNGDAAGRGREEARTIAERFPGSQQGSGS